MYGVPHFQTSCSRAVDSVDLKMDENGMGILP